MMESDAIRRRHRRAGRYSWLRAPATITTCSERSPVSGDLFAFPPPWAAPQHRRQIPFQFDSKLALARGQDDDVDEPTKRLRRLRCAFLVAPGPERASSPSGDTARPSPDVGAAAARLRRRAGLQFLPSGRVGVHLVLHFGRRDPSIIISISFFRRASIRSTSRFG